MGSSEVWWVFWGSPQVHSPNSVLKSLTQRQHPETKGVTHREDVGWEEGVRKGGAVGSST